MNEMLCPNCGRRLVDYRAEKQAAGGREVELHWTICVHCRHVALDSWSFADRTQSDGQYAVSSVPEMDGHVVTMERSERAS